MELMVMTKLPLPLIVSLKLPSLSVTAIFTALPGFSFLAMLIVAYGSPSRLIESTTVPLTVNFWSATCPIAAGMAATRDNKRSKSVFITGVHFFFLQRN